MSGETPQDLARRTVVYELPGTDSVRVTRDVEVLATDGQLLTMDVYAPAANGGARPVVVLVAGYPDDGFSRFLGCRFKDMGSTISWARLIAASGLVAVVYANRQPAADLEAVLAHIGGHVGTLGIDGDCVGLLASSGHVPLALSAIMAGTRRICCAALCYGMTLDLDGSGAIAAGARQFGFVNPVAGKTVADLPTGTPLFIARAGADRFPGLNANLDRFIAQAIERNLPISVVNHPHGPHAFDLVDDSGITREVVSQLLRFLVFHLTQPSANA